MATVSNISRQLFYEERYPFRAQEKEIWHPSGRRVKVRRPGCQVRLWISVTSYAPDESEYEDAPCLEAVVDPGLNHTLSLREMDLRMGSARAIWVPDLRNQLRIRTGDDEVRVPRIDVNLWIHPSENLSHLPPYRIALTAQNSAAYYPKRHKYRTTKGALVSHCVPHVPLLGLRALCEGLIRVEFECDMLGITFRMWTPLPGPRPRR